jgi:hypothetical protein
MIAVRCSSLLAAFVFLAVSTAAAASDETLARAKDLYRSAAYDEALTVLDQIANESSGVSRVESERVPPLLSSLPWTGKTTPGWPSNRS